MANIWDKLEDKTYQMKIGNSIKSKDISYHSIHYNIKPPSIDHSKPGSLHCTNSNSDTFVVEYNNQQSEEKYQFIGNQKEVNKELILLYDEETNTITLERLDSTFFVKRDTFKKSRSTLSDINNTNNSKEPESETFNIFESIALPPISQSNKPAQKTTTNKKSKSDSSTSNHTNSNNDDDESVQEFDLESDNQEETIIENPFSAYKKKGTGSSQSKKNNKSTKQQPPKYNANSDYNDDDNIIKEFEENLAEFDIAEETEKEIEENLEEFDVAEEAEKEIEEFSLEDEFEQELEKELEIREDDEDAKLSDNDLKDEIVDALELSSSEEDSDDMSPSNKRPMNQGSPGAKRPKPDVHDGPISLSAFAGNEEEEEESSSSSSDD
ncbi:RNA polymerase II transcription elongation factor-domain-containing protein [Neocallimastix sp. 'constans']|jgi:hypothetical protein